MSVITAALTSLGTVAIILGITACLVVLIVGTDPTVIAEADRMIDDAPDFTARREQARADRKGAAQ